MQKQLKPTSRAGHEHIKPHKPTHHQRILEALEKIRVGATHEVIAEVAGLRPDQVWKRLSELERDGKIFDTGVVHKLKSGVIGTVWQLTMQPKSDNQIFLDNLLGGKLDTPIQQPYQQKLF